MRRCGVSRFAGVVIRAAEGVLCLVLSIVLLAFAPADACSAEASSPSVSSGITNNITDTQNLLGSAVTTVSNAIVATKKQTGVTVKLLYVPSFSDIQLENNAANASRDPAAWAEDLLTAQKPVPNTVLLAVASQEGRLVAVVSRNSASWLRSQRTVNELSDAAQGPLEKGQIPDWSQSALAFLNEIDAVKRRADEAPIRRAWTIVGIVVGILLAGVAVAVVIILRCRRRSKPGKHAGGHHLV